MFKFDNSRVLLWLFKFSLSLLSFVCLLFSSGFGSALFEFESSCKRGNGNRCKGVTNKDRTEEPRVFC